jgi:GT2 family glycosyltransferase
MALAAVVKAAPSVEMNASHPLVIVLNWNGEQELLDCLESLDMARRMNPDYPFDVLLVDNGSTGGLFSQAARQFPAVKILALPDNLYWAGGNNAAIAWALERSYAWLVFCNSDIVVDGRWSEALAHFDAAVEIAAVGFRVLGEYSRVPFAAFEQAQQEFRVDQLSAADELYISGCFLAIRADCFRRLGVFDPVYRMYSEEDDFLMRLRLAGWRTVRCSAPIWHASELASRRVPRLTAYLAIRNSLRLRLKFGPRRLRSSLGFALRVLAGMLNPRREVDLVNSYQRRLKPSPNPLVNLPILAAACLWNLIHLPETLQLAHRDRLAALRVRV